MSMDIIAIQNIHGYVDEQGTVHIKAGDVARGLGFVSREFKNGKEYVSVRWSVVKKYLSEFGFLQEVAEDSFIPENMVYRLAMKANNETAQKFQAKLADEILPQIRKTGTYKSEKRPITPEYLREIADQLEDAERRAKENLDAKLLQDQATSIGKKYKHKLGRASKCLNVKGLGRNTLYSFLRDNNILFYDEDGYNEVYQRYINEEKFFQRFDDTYEYPIIYITPKGMRYVLQMLVNEGYEPRMSAEEWDMLCRQLPENEE